MCLKLDQVDSILCCKLPELIEGSPPSVDTVLQRAEVGTRVLIPFAISHWLLARLAGDSYERCVSTFQRIRRLISWLLMGHEPYVKGPT